MSDRIVIDVDRDGWTERLQLNVARLDENGQGWGYRLAGPKYNGSSTNLLRATLDERDAAEIRAHLDAVFPLAADSPAIAAATPLFLAEFDGAEPTVHLTSGSARSRCDALAEAVADGRRWDWSRNEHGAYVQFWTHPDDGRALHFTGGEVTEVRVQPEDGAADIIRPDEIGSAHERLVAALAGSPEVRPGTAEQLAAELIADVLRAAAGVQRAALDRGVPAEAPSVGGYIVDLIDPDAEKDTRGALPLLAGESTRARRSADRLAAFLGGARVGRAGGVR
ncbi:hypothetical protein [Streptomyces sp. NPDC101115]|uniref:hypothetical protein n=1 Tax=Streptomyces sp. NPDC101115 TaxID=3366106 RepID=UPI00382F20EC